LRDGIKNSGNASETIFLCNNDVLDLEYYPVGGVTGIQGNKRGSADF
jgi:hypothetical protein